jgi:hypothetical protein
LTVTKKQILPALHKSGAVKTPDLVDIGDKNYTSTILKYGNLALPFPQLETSAKTIVPAINELYNRPSGDANLYYYSYTNDNAISIPASYEQGTSSGGELETENGDVIMIDGTSSELEIPLEVDVRGTPTINEILIATIVFNYSKKTALKAETELNMTAYPNSAEWSKYRGNLWYRLRYYIDGNLMPYSPYESIHYWEDWDSTPSKYTTCGLCRDFVYKMEDVKSGEHTFEIKMICGGLDHIEIPIQNCNVILNELGIKLSEESDKTITAEDTLVRYGFTGIGFNKPTDTTPNIIIDRL